MKKFFFVTFGVSARRFRAIKKRRFRNLMKNVTIRNAAAHRKRINPTIRTSNLDAGTGPIGFFFIEIFGKFVERIFLEFRFGFVFKKTSNKIKIFKR